MSEQYGHGVTNVPGKAVTLKADAGVALGPLELNVIFTDQASTAAALAFAQSLARDLGARIHLQFAFAVPFQLPLDKPAVSVSFLHEQLRKVLSELERDGFEPTADLYLCRDRVQALLQALKWNSLIVIGGRKHLWPAAESRMADTLLANGHHVIIVDSKSRLGSERAIVAR